MAILDIILLVLLIPGVLSGISKGFTRQLIDLIAIIVSIWASCKYHIQLADFLGRSITMEPRLLGIISFAAIFIACTLIFGLWGLLINKIIDLISLGWLNKLLGVLLGLFKSALVLGMLILVFESINGIFAIVDSESLSDSLLYPALKEFALDVFPLLKSLITGTAESVGGIVNV